MVEEMKAVCLVLHDVAPSTWADYQPFVEAVDALGDVPMTWLVVPDFHRHDVLDATPEFRRVLDARVARGDELALHGYYHDDQEPLPNNPRDWFMRRVYTHEGEFYRLSREAALARLHAGLEMFQRYDWPVHGFVAPAWLMSDGTRQALCELPLSYTSDPQHLYRLPDFSAIAAPGLVWSARSAWRRGLSKIVSDQREQRWREASVIRLGLHPVDMRHRFSRDYWLHTLQRLLAEGRVPLTKIDWLARQRGQLERAA
ncbi:polysaccharide deacetylase family protein [Pseudomonas mercuritolerans]|uniref:Polysaccharide deacetylase family protein n=1 Tax=Pseudomonas mercuritolerans TaxID=2951809 RepID=A0ABT2XUG7_9PSED|nr:polysaccharide deacetylase family protein [Pseudomonas mercuritolerans]MCV2222350.1 polysaccharide deacetylase family protein [Pseudomonas mercuritolerans]